MKHRTIIFTTIIAILIMQASCSKEHPVTDVTDFRNYSVGPGDVVMTVSPDSVAADGKMYAAITINVGQNVRLHHKNVTFDISQAGKFADGSASINKALDNSGTATVYAVAGAEGIGIVKAAIDSIVRTASVLFSSSDPLSIIVTQDSVAADNTTYAGITIVTKRGNVAPANTQIILTTTGGTFNNNATTFSVPPSANDTTKIYLRNNNPGTAEVSATYAGAIRRITVTFTPAVPDLITIDPDSAIFHTALNATMRVTAKLFRNYGKASDGQVVYFKDSTEQYGSSIGIFLNSTASNAGTATANYFIQDTSFHGYLHIIGYVQKNNGAIAVSSRKRIRVQ